MRPPILRATFIRPDELVVDNFAGGGGASTGIEAALGRPVDMAINHSPEAIAMHKANHPNTRHFCENIWEVDPKEACGGRPVGLAWFSPDCTHFSRAKGSVPLKKEIRGLAWVVIRWARDVHPRIIILENVEEFQTWGPLTEDNRPDKSRTGETFREWCAALTDLGYIISFHTLVAADYGAPTTRKRLFLVARCDGVESAFPEKTHGVGREHRWIPASEIIDWSLACPSIFERSKPLKEATLRRIAAGIKRFVLESANPFVILLTHQGGDRGRSTDEPMATITAAHRSELALISPTLITQGFGERVGQAPRVPGLDKPLGTVVAQGTKHALVAAFLAKHYGGVTGQTLERTIGTVTAVDHHSLATAFLTKFYGTSRAGCSCEEPVPTITGGAAGGHMAEVRAFLVKYYGTGGQLQDLFSPLHTVTNKARFGLVTVAGEQYEIADIGMRMLQPHELYAAQGFPDDYEICPEFNGKPLTKTAQVSLAGNSVCPPVAAALVQANNREVA
jgi:DNA (cytosine-5)-methyltransferase 1